MEYLKKFGKKILLYFIALLIPYFIVSLSTAQWLEFRPYLVLVVFTFEILVVLFLKVSTGKYLWELTKEDLAAL